MPLPISSFPSAALGCFAICTLAVAQPSENVASHCREGEFAYLNARMSNVHYQDGGYHLIETRKVISICGDRNSEPFQSVVYRFGPVGNVEMERVATQSSKFHIFNRSTSPHTGQNVIFFKSGPYTYCVTEATAQGSGIGLTVLKSGRQVLHLFSGNRRGLDFDSELIEVNFTSARSPSFQEFVPLDPFNTPCDAKHAK